MNYLSIYTESYKYLVKKAKEHGISEQGLEKYFDPVTGNGKLFDCYGNKTKDNLLFRFAFHAQNGGQISKVIKFPQNPLDIRRTAFERIFCNFNPAKLLSAYSCVEELFDVFTRELDIRRISNLSKTLDHKKSMPYKYCKSVLSAARLLDEFDDYGDFINRLISLSDMAPLYISLEVSGFAIPLACDFIKELGIGIDLPKPDTHIVNIFYDLGLIPSKYGEEAQYKSIKIMKEFVKEIRKSDPSVTSYKLDKILWLICSETFYDDDNVRNTKNTKREEFIKYIKPFC